MNRISSAVLWNSLALVCLLACVPPGKSITDLHDKPADKAAAGKTSSGPGKPQAPVTVDSTLGAGTAHITVRFDAPASDVRVGVRGVDGLRVMGGETLLEGARVERGTVSSYDVTFTPGPGRSHLVVSVTGSFQGMEQARVSSFAVGTPTEAQRGASHAEKVESGGERIKIMPVGE